jgi:hypothetical protein
MTKRPTRWHRPRPKSVCAQLALSAPPIPARDLGRALHPGHGQLIAMRKEFPALRRGAVAPTALVALNVSDQTSETCAPVEEGGGCLNTSFLPGTTLVDVMPGGDGATFVVSPDGTIDVTVPARGGRVLVPR